MPYPNNVGLIFKKSSPGRSEIFGIAAAAEHLIYPRDRGPLGLSSPQRTGHRSPQQTADGLPQHVRLKGFS